MLAAELEKLRTTPLPEQEATPADLCTSQVSLAGKMCG